MPWSTHPGSDTEQPVRPLGAIMRDLLGAGRLPAPVAPTLADYLGPDADSCSTCRGLRVVRRDLPVEHPDFGRAIPCPVCAGPLLQQKRLDRLFGQLPPMFRDLTLESTVAYLAGLGIEPADLGATMGRWRLAEPRPWLWLWGGVGLGKTSLGVALLRGEIECGRTGTYRTVPRLLDRLKQTFDSGESESFEAVFRELLEVEVLLLDDLGKESPTRWARQTLFELVDERWKAHRLTLVTSNLAPWEVAEHLEDAAVPDRIRGLAGPEYVIELRGASVRGRAPWTG